jgi:hypothetical protein
MEQFSDMLEGFICDEVKEHHPEMHERFMAEFHELMNAPTNYEIEMAVGALIRKDHANGPKWGLDDVKTVAAQFNLHEKTDNKFSDHELWFAMNYAFAVHGAPNKTMSAYIELAIDELHDPNVCYKDKIRVLAAKGEANANKMSHITE